MEIDQTVKAELYDGELYETCWVYVQSEPNLWTVGHYGPGGKWNSESDHSSKEDAATRCHWLNGGD